MGVAPRARRVVGRLAAITTLSTMSVLGVPLVSGAAVPKRSPAGAAEQVQEAIATLVVEKDGVELRREGTDDFKAAKDDAELREGDTVRTDDTGRATIQYTDESFTRLDFNTEFTIVELTDDAGTRHTTGKLSVGRAWNRVEGLTESETFESEGAGATAVVEGTAYAEVCLNAAVCAFDGVVHDVRLTGADVGDTENVEELESALVVLGVVGDVETMSRDEFYANEWIQTNLAVDAFLGFDRPDWQKPVAVQTNDDDTNAVADKPAPPAPSTEPAATPPPTEEPPPPPAPVCDPTVPVDWPDGSPPEFPAPADNVCWGG